MTTIIVPTWLAWTLAITIGFPLFLIGVLCLILVVAAVVSLFKGGGKDNVSLPQI